MEAVAAAASPPRGSTPLGSERGKGGPGGGYLSPPARGDLATAAAAATATPATLRPFFTPQQPRGSGYNGGSYMLTPMDQVGVLA